MPELRVIPGRVSPTKLALAFAAIYFIWGSTFLAIRFSVESIPPLLMAGTRFLGAGAIIFAAGRLRGERAPCLSEWRAAAVIGGLLFLIGNGSVSWAEQRVPSGLAALMIATVPLWVMALQAVKSGVRPGGRPMMGVALGLAGVALLIGPGGWGGGSAMDPLGAAVLLLSALAWATGSVFSGSAGLPASPLISTGAQMLAGGVLLLAAGILTGEPARLASHAIAMRSLVALLYLMIPGSVVGFTAYAWLLRVVPPTRAATYAFVNPVVALVIGRALGGEALSPRALIAAAVILTAVAITVTAGRSGSATRHRAPRTFRAAPRRSSELRSQASTGAKEEGHATPVAARWVRAEHRPDASRPRSGARVSHHLLLGVGHHA